MTENAINTIGLADRIANEPALLRTRIIGELGSEEYYIGISAAERDLIVSALRSHAIRAVTVPSEEEVARAIFDSDYRAGDFDDDKAMCAREGIKWPSHSKLQYFKYARAVLALAPNSPDSAAPDEVSKLREMVGILETQFEQHCAEIERLRRALQAISNTDGYHRDGKDCTAEIMRMFANKALSSGQREGENG